MMLLNTTNENMSTLVGPAPSETLEFKVVKIFFYCIILLCSSIGNGLVIHVIKNTERMKTPSNILILNLALCDIITPILSILFDFPLEENKYKWIYGGFMCKIIWPGSTFSTTSSSLTLAAISFDRYRVIMHPFKPKLSMDQVKIIISVIHMFSIVIVTPYIYVLRLQDNECNEAWPQLSYRQVYTMILFLVQYCIPLIFMTIMYTMTLKSLYSASLKTWVMRIDYVEETPMNVSSLDPEQSTKNNNSGTRQTKKKKKARKCSHIRNTGVSDTNRKATKMFIAVVFVFAICMFPNQVVWLWTDFGEASKLPNYKIMSIICLMFTYANSVCNPGIYALFSADFRKGFYAVYGRLCCKTMAEYDLSAHHSNLNGGSNNYLMSQL